MESNQYSAQNISKFSPLKMQNAVQTYDISFLSETYHNWGWSPIKWKMRRCLCISQRLIMKVNNVSYLKECLNLSVNGKQSNVILVCC